MPEKIKLTYFDLRVRAEISRLVLAYWKKPYEDIRVAFQDFPKVKPTSPLGVLPVLEVDGQVFCQGLAIATYLAKECGLYGSTNLEQLMIDQIQQAREDLLCAEAKVHYTKDEAAKAEGRKKLMEETTPRVYNFFCKVIRENPTKSGFSVGNKLSLADLVMFEGTQSIWPANPQFLDNYPELKSLRAKVQETDGLKQYLAKRKETAG